MLTPLLPRLWNDDRNTVTNIDNPGIWIDQDVEELQRISQSLDVEIADANFSNVDSIPNMWARPLLFEMALYGAAANHPMHNLILGEWRGLLALLALKERRNFPLTTQTVEISPENENEDSGFLQALRRLLPQNTLHPETTWDKLHIFLFNNNPIGFTSPTTLVCTPINYAGNIQNVPWYNGEYLCDPIDYLDSEEKEVFAGWLQTIHERFDPQSNPDLNEELGNILRGLLTAFINALIEQNTARVLPILSDNNLDLDQGIFNSLNQPIAAAKYFTDKLFVIQQQNALEGILQPQVSEGPLIGSDRQQQVTPILPIGDRMLTDDVDVLNQRITFEKVQDGGGIKVYQRLTLENGMESETSREYRYSSDNGYQNWGIVEIPPVPDNSYFGRASQSLLFQKALYSQNHLNHTRVLGEWRGLLALLALKERRNFLLTTQAQDDNDTTELLSGLRRLLLQNTLHPETGWDSLHTILFNDNPIGFTSPTTLVCPFVNYTDNIQDVPWYNGEYLCDPIDYLDSEEKEVFAGWLQTIHESNHNLNEELGNTLQRLITAFIRDLIGQQTARLDPELSDNQLGLDQGIFRCLNQPIAAAAYFTDKLLVIQVPDAFPGGLQPNLNSSLGNNITPILPIRENLLVDNDIDTLNQRITFEPIENKEGIKVSLTLELQCRDQQIVASETSREYSDEEIVGIPNVPVLEIWPNFSTPDWKVYYTYFSTGSQDTFYAHPLTLGNEESTSRKFPKSDGKVENEITRTSFFPKAMRCKYGEDEDAGVLLTSPAALPDSSGGTWTVGIDFGTTSTTVYRNGGRFGLPVKFENRLIRVTQSNVEIQSQLYDYFFSPDLEGQETPFFSLFHAQPNDGNNGGPLRQLLDGHIYFLNNYEEFTNALNKPQNPQNPETKFAGTICHNLKWSRAQDDRRRTRAFLEQLCLQCAAEAVSAGTSQINWRFSFPMAFSPLDQSRFNEMWEKDVTPAITKVTGLQLGEVTSEPESIVIAKYFANPETEGNFGTGAVCIDIGGETSDISIWQNRLYSQTSLRFAGRGIFLNLLERNPQFLKNFNVPDEIWQKFESEDKPRYVEVDALLEEKQKDKIPNWKLWLDVFKEGRDQDNTPFKRFAQLIAIGIAGLLYYVGLLLRYLSENQGYEYNHIHIYIGGKGSRILEWFGGERDVEQPLLKQVLCDASGYTTDQFHVVISEKPKEEAASGLVGQQTLQWEDTEYQNLILAGESFTIGQNYYEWTENLTPELLDEVLKPSDDLAQIKNFIESFNKNAGQNQVVDKIQMDENAIGLLKDSLEDWLDKARNDTSIEERRAEPLFILALKNLLNSKTKKWSEEENVRSGN